MTAEEYLSHIGSLEYDIRRLEAELEKARADMLRIQSMDASREHVDGGEPSDIADRIGRLIECEAELNAERGHYIKQREEAKRFLAELVSSKFRAVLTEHYILGRPWEAVADHLDIGLRQIWRVRQNALGAFQKNMESRHPGFLENFCRGCK